MYISEKDYTAHKKLVDFQKGLKEEKKSKTSGIGDGTFTANPKPNYFLIRKVLGTNRSHMSRFQVKFETSKPKMHPELYS